MELVEYFKCKEISLITFKENLDTTTPTEKLMITMIGAISEFERECLFERQREGIALAKSEVEYKVRKKIDFPENLEVTYNKYKIREIPSIKAMELLGLKRNTFYT